MDGPDGWGLLDGHAAGGGRPVVAADAGYRDDALLRGGLAAAAGGTWSRSRAPSAPARTTPSPRRWLTAAWGGPASPAPHRPLSLRQLAIAHAGQIQLVTWRQGTKATAGDPDAAMTSDFDAIGSGPPAATCPAPTTAASRNAGCWPNGPPGRRAFRLWLSDLRRHPWPSWCGWPRSAGAWSTTTANSKPDSAWTTSKSRSWRLAPPRHPRRPRPGLHRHDPHRPKSACAGMTLYQVLRELQIVLALILGACPLC